MTTTAEFARMVIARAQRRPRRYPRPGDLARLIHNADTSPALKIIDDALVELTDDPHAGFNALGVFMPPQEGKSQRVSRAYAEWLLDHDPTLRIAIVSYAEDLAIRWGRDIKLDVAQNPCQSHDKDCRKDDGLHIKIRVDSSAAGRWQTPQGGGIYCVGVGGPLTGQPVDILIIDDPIKDRKEAESKVIRKSTWDWWESVALERLAPRAKIILIQTRWHEDDLAGRMMSRPSPLKWKWITIPAIADTENDPLGRKIGEELPSVRGRDPGHFRNLQATLSPYVFAGVYQQSPKAAEGNFFRRASFRYWREMEPWADGRERLWTENGPVTLQDCFKFITMDFAASTKNTADYTVASCWAITPAGDLILLDRTRARVPDHQHFAMAEPLRQRWGAVTIYIEQNWWSKTFATDARDKGIGVAGMRADTDKVTRAIPAAGRVHSGRVYFPAEAPWLEVWVEELAIFPQGSNDDQVDTLSYAVLVQINEWTPASDHVSQVPLTVWDQAQVSQAYDSFTGGGEVDPMSVPY